MLQEIDEWIKEEKKKKRFKGHVVTAYSLDNSLQNLFEDNKDRSDDILSYRDRDAFLFSDGDDMNSFMNYWRKERGVKEVTAVQINDGPLEDGILEFYKQSVIDRQSFFDNFQEDDYPEEVRVEEDVIAEPGAADGDEQVHCTALAHSSSFHFK